MRLRLRELFQCAQRVQKRRHSTQSCATTTTQEVLLAKNERRGEARDLRYRLAVIHRALYDYGKREANEKWLQEA